MYTFSESSKKNVDSCDPKLKHIAYEMIKVRDFSVTCGVRSKFEQDRLYDEGKTLVKWPNSKHNIVGDSGVSRAFDIQPYPIRPEDWSNREFWIEWSSWVKGFASALGYSIISGFDWDNDYNYDEDEQTFWDGPHFELHKDED